MGLLPGAAVALCALSFAESHHQANVYCEFSKDLGGTKKDSIPELVRAPQPYIFIWCLV
jgi:hypothetical protein